MEAMEIVQIKLSDTTQPIWYRHEFPGRSNTLLHDTAIDVNTKPRESFFNTSQSPTTELKPVSMTVADKDWLYGSFAIVLLMIVVLRLLYPLRINKLFRTLLFPGKGKPDDRLFEFRFDLFTIFFIVIYSITFSLLVISFLNGFSWLPVMKSEETVQLFFMFAVSFCALLVLKIIVSRIAASIFSTKNQSEKYQDHLLVSAFTTSALIIPLIVVNVFSASTAFIFAAAIVLLATLTVRIFRTVSIVLDLGSFSHIHFILYFCTLEIIPLLIIGKIILMLLI